VNIFIADSINFYRTKNKPEQHTPIPTTKNPMDVEKSVRIDKKGVTHTHYFLRQSRREGQKNYQNDNSQYHQLGRTKEANGK
jgi:hypothetical protein